MKTTPITMRPHGPFNAYELMDAFAAEALSAYMGSSPREQRTTLRRLWRRRYSRLRTQRAFVDEATAVMAAWEKKCERDAAAETARLLRAGYRVERDGTSNLDGTARTVLVAPNVRRLAEA